MKFEKIYNKGQATIFDSRRLEKLTKTHPLTIFAIYIPVIFGLLYFSKSMQHFNTGFIMLLFAAGLFSWTIFEYFAHRFAFHFHAKSDTGKKIVYILHGNHHEYPRDKKRLFMPAVPSILIAFTLFMVVYFIAGLFISYNIATSFFPGFITGYLLYGSMHYAIHAWAPPFKWMKPLWRNHHLHHYKDEDHGFGVSSTLWDHAFGTMFDLKNEKEDKQKTAELIYERKKLTTQQALKSE
jgi:sterol desaturase/sphingolipid hydroxylase (fatty acid hydroxylase superfamily)